MQSGLTELEGAVLSEIHHRGALTAFKVRKAFQDSPSIEWSGSSGAVYPAIRRMTESGLIQEKLMAQARKVNHLALTQTGIDALNQWIVAPQRATSVGLDPFRLRAGLWPHLPAEVRKEGLQRVKGEIESEVEHLRAWQRTGFVDAVRHFVPETEKLYTWWSYRNQDWQLSNRGRRLDHIWVTPDLRPKLKRYEILQDARNWPQTSDHVPVMVEF